QLHAYVARLTSSIAQTISKLSIIQAIETDSEEQLARLQTQLRAPWGISRLSYKHRQLGSDKYNYKYDDRGGANSTVYVLDSGIEISHSEFRPAGHRAKWGINLASDHADFDVNGHGTHVAAIIGGKQFGLAKSTHLVAVKMFDKQGRGRLSDLLSAFRWIIQDHDSSKTRHSIINFSGVGKPSQIRNLFIQAALDAGIVVIAAAGNNRGSDACTSGFGYFKSLSSTANGLLLVGSSTSTDAIADFSNNGPCVDLFAPGVDIRSAFINGQSKLSSGTSLSAAHVSGVVANLWTVMDNWTPTQIAQSMRAANPGLVTGSLEGANNALLY
ncbi:peptidase S8/S53 domain-containing protein, partial [Lipomyces oligophaga]|uniref:peptidase S8/S53 domain-containing protein n=1 Tax=Lipomyces oligophaga TaxID=45792 RepID=UPI0034CD9C0C